MYLPVVYKHGVGEHFDIIKYPDGQQNVKLDMEYFNDPKIPVDIKCSVRDFSELEVLLALCASLRRHDFHISNLTFNYLFGMRSDRSFEPGMPNYFRDVVAPILNSFNVKSSILYPHSRISCHSLRNTHPFEVRIDVESDCLAIHADASFGWHECHFDEPMHFSKCRDGNELSVILKNSYFNLIEDAPQYKPILIKDDLCDGGATFIAIANYLENNFPNRLRYLFVAHGLFTKGVDHVATHFDKIITTNSFQEFEAHPKLEIINVWK